MGGKLRVLTFILPVVLINIFLLISSSTHADEINANQKNIQQCIPPPSNIVSWWPAEGNADDLQGINNGTLLNGATFAIGKVGQTFSFDGIDDYIFVQNSPTLQNVVDELTLEAWIYTTSLSEQMIMVKRDSVDDKQWYFRVVPVENFIMEFNMWDGSEFRQILGTQNVPINQWNHVAAVYNKNAQTLTLYLNGVGETFNYPYIMQSYSSNVYIGSHSPFYNEMYFDGFIDEATIYNRALSSSEIQAIYNASSAGKCKPEIPSSPIFSCDDVESA